MLNDIAFAGFEAGNKGGVQKANPAQPTPYRIPYLKLHGVVVDIRHCHSGSKDDDTELIVAGSLGYSPEPLMKKDGVGSVSSIGYDSFIFFQFGIGTKTLNVQNATDNEYAEFLRNLALNIGMKNIRVFNSQTETIQTYEEDIRKLIEEFTKDMRYVLRAQKIEDAFNKTTFTRNGQPVPAKNVFAVNIGVEFSKTVDGNTAPASKTIEFSGGDGVEVTNKVITFPEK
ncbi:MAG: hypothetical protein HY811_09050 [Planctomycetes bacterium]|nr:hypothetical protein [Planctomycetota bacterium]